MTYSTNLPLHDLRTWLEQAVEQIGRDDAMVEKLIRSAMARIDVLVAERAARQKTGTDGTFKLNVTSVPWRE